MIGRNIRTLTIVALAVVISSCVSGGAGGPVIAPTIEPETQDLYQIGAGDVLTISVWGNADLSLTVPVRPDGHVSMPLIGDILASNKDAQTLAADITTALSGQLRNPQVTVIVAQVNSVQYVSRVRVTGAVRAPVSLPYARGMSVLDAILEAGGINEVASANKAKLYRRVEGELGEYDVRLDDILLRGNLETNYPLQPGDVITVPERLF